MNQRSIKNEEAQIRVEGSTQPNNELVPLSAEALQLVGGGMRVALHVDAVERAPYRIQWT